MIELPWVLPTVELVPRPMAGLHASRRDVQVESAEFNRRWSVASADFRYAHAMLSPKMMETLLAPGMDVGSIVISGRWLYSVEVAFGPRSFAHTVRSATLLADMVQQVSPNVVRSVRPRGRAHGPGGGSALS